MCCPRAPSRRVRSKRSHHARRELDTQRAYGQTLRDGLAVLHEDLGKDERDVPDPFREQPVGAGSGRLEREAPLGGGERACHLTALVVEEHHEPVADWSAARLVDDLPGHRLCRHGSGGQTNDNDERSGRYNPTDTPNRARDCWIGTSIVVLRFTRWKP